MDQEVADYQNQLQEELQNIIEEHNNRMNAEIERENQEKLKLQEEFQKEISALKEKHRNDIEKEKKVQEKSSQISKQVFHLQFDEITNQNEEIGGTNNYTQYFDEKFNKFISQLEKTLNTMENLSQHSQNNEEYEILHTIHKKQNEILIKMLSVMKFSCFQEVKELFAKQAIIDKTYYSFFQNSLE